MSKIASRCGIAGAACIVWLAFGLAAERGEWPRIVDDVAAADGAAPARPGDPVPADASGVNVVTRAAVQQGVLTCAARINEVTNFFGLSEPRGGGLLLSPPAPADRRVVPIALEVPTEDGGAYVSATFAPNQANGCGAKYDAVVWWPQACGAVASSRFAAFRTVGRLEKSIVVLDGGPTTKVFLMPAGSGCVSIKKEVVL